MYTLKKINKLINPVSFVNQYILTQIPHFLHGGLNFFASKSNPQNNDAIRVLGQPYHMVQNSPWPFVMSIAVLGNVFSLILWMFYVQTFTLVLLSFFITLGVAGCWFQDLHHEYVYQGQMTNAVKHALRIGMILFISSEVWFFVSFFWAYFHNALNPSIFIGGVWPPFGLLPWFDSNAVDDFWDEVLSITLSPVIMFERDRAIEMPELWESERPEALSLWSTWAGNLLQNWLVLESIGTSSFQNDFAVLMPLAQQQASTLTGYPNFWSPNYFSDLLEIFKFGNEQLTNWADLETNLNIIYEERVRTFQIAQILYLNNGLPPLPSELLVQSEMETLTNQDGTVYSVNRNKMWREGFNGFDASHIAKWCAVKLENRLSNFLSSKNYWDAIQHISALITFIEFNLAQEIWIKKTGLFADPDAFRCTVLKYCEQIVEDYRIWFIYFLWFGDEILNSETSHKFHVFENQNLFNFQALNFIHQQITGEYFKKELFGSDIPSTEKKDPSTWAPRFLLRPSFTYRKITNLSTWNPYNMPLAMTVILITSGITLTASHMAVRIERLKLKEATQPLILTLLLALAFLLLQAFEYVNLPLSINDSVFGSVFFMATGFHGFHVLVGGVFLFVCLVRLYRGYLATDSHVSFECAIWYWHFVDVVWIFLFIAIYWWAEPEPLLDWVIIKFEDIVKR